MNMNKNRLVSIALAVLITLLGAGSLYALRPPHDKASNNITCGSCHKTGVKIRGFNPLCVSECHNTLSSSNAKRKPLDLNFASNIFGTFTNVTPKKQFSHAWSTQPNYSTANKNNKGAGTNKYISMNQASVKGVSGTSTIICPKCHYAHGIQDTAIAASGGTINKPFIRVSTKGDFICFQCHEERRVGAGAVRSAPVAGKAYSHPVEVNYSTIRAGKSDFYETSPTNTYGLPSANLPLYTTYGNVKGAVVCSTCHGPLHSADSNPYTLDNISAFSMGQYSTGDGKLLRRYSPSKDNNMCLACHKVKTHQGKKCGDCHEPHKKAGDNNLYLIKKVIATAYGNHSVFFTSTTQMAKRYGVYSWPYSSRSTAVCQVCHRSNSKKRHYAYSTAGGDNDHKYLGGGKFEACMACHPHNAQAGGFAAEGCGGCHEGPPIDDYGKHGKHTNSSARHDWATGNAVDTRSSSNYGFACSRCHVRWNPYTSLRHYPAGFSDSTVANYTAEVDFKYTATLPKQDTTKATYTYGSSYASYDPGANPGGSTFRAPNTSGGAGTCNNLYCHGQFYNGYTGFNPTWQGTAACGTCHGATQELGRGLPGNMKNSTNWGAHPRHVGGAAQQYGAGTPNFRCNACHVTSATQNAISSVGLDRTIHVNGRINVKFDAAYDAGSATYNGMNSYTAQINTTITKPAYKTCGLIYCHSDGSRMSNYSAPFNATQGSGTGKFPNWSTSKNFTTTVAAIGGKSRCARCHGNATFKGITASMPGVTSKGNSHEKHIRNGFLCYDCHSQTVASDSRNIASTSKHVNKTWDVDIISRYGGTYNGVTKTCDNVKCHGGRKSPAWGTTGRCQDCHYKSTAEATADEGYADNYAWKSMTSTASVPRIYSAEWTGKGHGASGGKLPKVCTDCHKASGTASHSSAVTSNPFRLYTAASHIDDMCQACHGTGGARSTEADKKVISHTAAAVGGDATWAFTPKCVDCHDPHGDNNRAMIQKYINFTTGSDSYGKVSSPYANFIKQVTFTTVGGGLINWSSFVKSDFTGICQRCHNTQANMSHFRKYSTSTGDGYNANHNPGSRCTNCHTHDTGFKPKDCAGCHYYPPVLSGKHSFHVATTVAKVYVGYEVNNTKTKYAYGCGKCHDSGAHYVGASGNYTTEVVFDGSNTVPKNPNGSYAFGAKSSFDEGADGVGGFKWTSTKGTCRNTFCHGQFFGGYTGNDPNWYNNGADDPQTCGKCHGAVKNTSGYPTGGAHVKHLDTTKYNMPCKTCHREVTGGFNSYTVSNRQLHVNGVTNMRLYTTNGDATVGSRIGRYARYGSSSNDFANVTTNTNAGVVPTYRYCLNTYCHSRGTSTLNPYTSKVAYPNYTAFWGYTGNQRTPAGQACALCHGNKTYKGITAAMPFQTGQAHKIHVVDNNFTKCYICHSNVVDSNNNIVSTTNHVNQFKNISVIKTYKSGQELYSSTVAAKKTCKNIKCHGGRITPLWTVTGKCSDCHYSTASPEDNFAWTNYSGTNLVAARIYSSEWVKRGHGKTKTSGKYPFSNNTGAGKVCDTCHTKDVKHNQSNYFRLLTATGTDSNALCNRCHGTGSQLKTGFGRITGIQSHTWQIISTEGYKGGVSGKAGWNNPAPKCVDCHDPHGDANNAMLHTYINMTGSDSVGRPSPTTATAQVVYTAVGGQINWSSYVRSGNNGICQRCHSAEVDFFDKAQFANHNNGQICKNCHKHKKGFAPSGCDACHGYPPPDGPTRWAEKAATSATVGLHDPHSRNTRGRPGIPAENDLTSYKGYKCNRCHGGVAGSADNGQATDHGTGVSGGKYNAGMKNMTMVYGDWNKGTMRGYSSVTDDTCSTATCHTPRNYARKWAKPAGCDDCHGTIRLRGATERAYKLHTTMSHKIHINYTGVANPPASWGKNYRFACTNCHYNAQNNFSTHYSGQVNITSNGPVNTVGGQFYTRGRSFKGFTTGNEVTTTTYCTKTYCHGNFTNGTTTVKPSWKKGATTLNCGSCHKAKTSKVSVAWSVGTTMPARHPKHVRTATYNFSCSKCHVRTVTNNTTVFFQYSAHVNGQVNVAFDSVSGTFSSDNKTCQSNYCHSRGAVQSAPYTVANYTAKWTDSNKGCNYCHGDKSQTWAGITSAMPNNNAHIKHARNTSGDNFKCYVCHANVVNSNGAIISYTNHVNKFKNISVIKTYKTAQEGYSSTVAAKKTCKNIKCHAGRGTPLWTGSADCRDCHYKSSGFTSATTESNWRWQNYTTGKAASIYSTEYRGKGHGKSGLDKACSKCHVTDPANAKYVKHNTGSNPFRLYTSDSNKMCAACHGTGSELGKWGVGTLGNKTGITTHSQSETQGDAAWDFPSSNPTQKSVKCVDCHDPHGDSNRSMIQSYINFTGSDPYGKPDAVNTSHPGQMIFTTVGGNQMNWSSFVHGTDLTKSLCRRCHTNQGDGKMGNFNKGVFTAGHNNGQKCTNCHSHKGGFAAGGEPSGTEACGSCHSLYTKMRATDKYHHVMQSDAGTFNNKTSYTGSVADQTSTSRNCLMCHVRHKEFSPDVTPGRKRAANLRRKATATHDNQTGINTDFWPAKRTGSGPGSYNATNPVSGPSGSYGVCMSCHDAVQYKNTSLQREDGTKRAMTFPIKLYTSSSHNFQIISGMNNFSEGSSFRANCSKCHRSDFIDKSAKQTGTKFGLHDRKEQSLLNYSADTAAKPKIEEMCYNCHDTGVRESYDYYSSIKMNSGSKMIKTAIVAKKSGHPIDSDAAAGRHRVDEYDDAAEGTWNPASNRHVECTDCHNTHGGNAAIARRIGGPFSGRLNTSDTQKLYSSGNKVAGSQAGAWGVQLTYGSTMGVSPTFTKTDQVKYQYELCIKCHSSYAYGSTPPGAPSGLPDTAVALTSDTPYQNLDPTVPQADIAKLINKNNYGFHPIYQKGRNQPGKSLNANWGAPGPAVRSDWKYIDRLTNRTAFIAVSGLSWTFVPPYSQHSLLACSDCHQADNTGLAVGRLKNNGSQTVTVAGTLGWTGATASNISKAEDALYAQTGNACINCTIDTAIDFTGSYPTNQPSQVLAVAYGYSTDASSTGRKDNTLGIYSGATPTLLGSAVTVKTAANNNSRYEANTGITRTWAQLDTGTKKVKFVVDTSNAGIVYIDYLGIEAVYATTGDVRGPHGSLERWILTTADRDIFFDADNNGNLTYSATGGPGTDLPNKNIVAGSQEEKNLCYNCHRRDVYGWEGAADGAATYSLYSRARHPLEGGGRTDNPLYNVWGIWCMNCHAGGGTGEIHGSFANRTTAAGWWGATRTDLLRPRGVRLLNGAVFNAKVDTGGNITCYTPNVATAFATPGCAGQHEAGSAGGTTQYSYTNW